MGFLLGLILLMGMGIYGQQRVISGRVVDTIAGKSIRNAVIALLRQEDSTLISFVRSGGDGSFGLKAPLQGKFFLLVTHPDFSPFSMPVEMPAGIDPERVYPGAISLLPRSSTLATAIVSQRRPVLHLKGDTVEYDAASVKVKTNANVEDLLKQLPGVEVNQKGEIMAQGEKIQKILVDGEEFFSDDPTIATRNLNADMVDKVQILNKKSPQAEFTGIDDGKTTKTLNLTLREDKKRGYFGKLEAGAGVGADAGMGAGAGTGAGTGAGQYYNDNALAGSFKNKRKLSAFAMVSNTGQSSLSGVDEQSFGDGDNVPIPAGLGAADNFGASGATGGVPQTENAGVHYSNKWNEDGQHLSGNYRYNHVFNNPFSSTLTWQTLPDTIYYQSQQTHSISSKDQHTLAGVYELNFDSLSSLRLSFGGLTEEGRNQDAFSDSTLLNNIPVNNNRRSSDAHIDNQNFIGNILWRKKFLRPGKTFSAYLSLHNNDQHTYGFLYSIDNYYQPNDSLLSSDTTDQKKDISTQTRTIEGNMLYTTPFWKDCVLAAGYSVAITHNVSLRGTWNKGSGKYDNYVDSLSSQYGLTISTQRVRLTAQIKKDRFTFTLGGDMSYAGYRQTDLLEDTSLRYHYLNFFPHLEARYTMSPFKALSFNYYGNTQQPSIYQIQPARNNNDPLNILIGNPGLQPAFSHSFRLGLNNYKPLAGRYVYAGVGLGFTTNSISNSSLIDSLGRNVTRTVNVNGNRNVQLYGSSSWDLHSLDLRLGFNGSVAYSRSVNFVNGLLNLNDNVGPAGGISIGRNIPDKYNFSINSNVNYIYSRNSVNPSATTRYWTQQDFAQAGVTIRGWFDWNTDCSYTWRQKLSATDNLNQAVLWNSWVERRFLKNTVTCRFVVNDILDQNKGMSTAITANQLVQSNFTTIRRYGMVSVIWNFISHGK